MVRADWLLHKSKLTLLESDSNSLPLESKQSPNLLSEVNLECKVMQLQSCRLVAR